MGGEKGGDRKVSGVCPKEGIAGGCRTPLNFFAGIGTGKK